MELPRFYGISELITFIMILILILTIHTSPSNRTLLHTRWIILSLMFNKSRRDASYGMPMGRHFYVVDFLRFSAVTRVVLLSNICPGGLTIWPNLTVRRNILARSNARGARACVARQNDLSAR